MEVEKTNKGLIKMNIDLHLQEEELTIGLIELIKVQVDPNEPSRVVKIGKGLIEELAQQLMEFLCQS